MSKKDIRKQKWRNFWDKAKMIGKNIWSIGKRVVPFIPGYGPMISGGMNLAEGAVNGIKKLFHKS